MSGPPVITFVGVAPQVGASTCALMTAVAAPLYEPAAISTVIDLHGHVGRILDHGRGKPTQRPRRLSSESRLADVVGALRRVDVDTGIARVGAVEILRAGSFGDGEMASGEAVAHVAQLLAGSGRTVTIDASPFDVDHNAPLVRSTAVVIVSDASRPNLDRARTLADAHDAACTIALNEPGKGALSRSDLIGHRAPVVPMARTAHRQHWFEVGCLWPVGESLFGLLVDASEVHSLAEQHLERPRIERPPTQRSGRGRGL